MQRPDCPLGLTHHAGDLRHALRDLSRFGRRIIGKTIVTIGCSTGERYLSTALAAEAKAKQKNVKFLLPTDTLVATPVDTGKLNKKGKPVYLRDIWPTSKEIDLFIRRNVTKKAYKARYADVFKGDVNWRKVKVPGHSGEVLKAVKSL